MTAAMRLIWMSQGFDVIGEASDGAEAVAVIRAFAA
jgi:YesN/AraC family two-component response regulator